MKGLDDGPDGLNDAAFKRALGGGRKGRRTQRARQRPVAPAASATADRDAIRRAVCDATTAALGEHPQISQLLSMTERGQLAQVIGRAALAKLAAAPRRVWTGTLGAPCWVCGFAHHAHDHSDGGACPPAVTTANGAQP